MYKISVPIILDDRFCKEDVLNALKKCGAERVFLSVDILSLNMEKHHKMIQLLRQNIPYFKSNGMETGIWFWTFWRSDWDAADARSLLMKGKTGKERVTNGGLMSKDTANCGFCCPASEQFLEKTMQQIRDIAECGADILMFDDDFRYGFLDDTLGCYCDSHMKMISKRLGKEISRKELFTEIYQGGANPIRSLWHRMMGEAFENFAYQVRQTVDGVDPNIRIAICSVMSLWDVDGGTSPMKLTKILAGHTKPLMRLIGAPYWAAKKSWGNRLQHVIELERMEAAWCVNEEIEIMTEGDVYPRPRYQVPASFLEGFDTALRAADVGDGILKYMFDYTSSIGYEKGYVNSHLKNADKYRAIERIFGNKVSVGVRVYETMQKFCDLDFTDVEEPENYAKNLFFSTGARMLSDNTIPIVYDRASDVGVVFGENARNLPVCALENALILDVRAAKILAEKGIDVGIEEFGEPIFSDLLFYPRQNEYVRSGYGKNSAYRIVPKQNADIVTYSFSQGVKFSDAFLYRNDSGQRFLVFAFDAAFAGEDRFRSYCMQNLLYDLIEQLGEKPLPAKCAGNPDLYILCKKNAEEMAVGLWNFFADEISEPVITLDQSYEEIDFVNCTGRMEGNTVYLSPIKAYEFAFICVK